MLVAEHGRARAAPRGHREDVVGARAVGLGLGLVEHGELDVVERRHVELLAELAHQRLGDALCALLVAAEDVPDAGIERPVGGALAQEDPAVADQDAAGAALHGPGALVPQSTR